MREIRASCLLDIDSAARRGRTGQTAHRCRALAARAPSSCDAAHCRTREDTRVVARARVGCSSRNCIPTISSRTSSARSIASRRRSVPQAVAIAARASPQLAAGRPDADRQTPPASR